jgi:hypothetical protein
MVVLALLPLIGFTALVVDFGMLQVERTQLQGALDAGALAGVGYLDGTEAGVFLAVEMAREFAAANTVMGEPVDLGYHDVMPGYYDVEQDHFVSSWDPEQVNALYVESELQGIGTFFAGAAFGIDFLSVQRSSIARRGTYYPAGKAPCFLPFAVPECFLDDPEGAEMMALRMSSANIDNTGWANPHEEVTDTGVANQLGGQCGSDPAVVGESVYLQNGQMNSAFQLIHDMLETSTDPWDTSKWGALPPPMGSEDDPEAIPGTKYSVSTVEPYGNVIQGPIIIFDPRGGECGASTQFNQTAPITGFAWAVVYDVDSKSMEKNLRVHLDMTYEYEYGTGPGGTDGSNVVWQDDHQLVY